MNKGWISCCQILLNDSKTKVLVCNHNLVISRAPLKSQAHQGNSLFTSIETNQRGCKMVVHGKLRSDFSGMVPLILQRIVHCGPQLFSTTGTNATCLKMLRMCRSSWAHVVAVIDVKNVFYIFYYFYKNAFLTFFIFWTVFYFLVAKFVILVNLLKSY